jgi:hypothetical protein
MDDGVNTRGIRRVRVTTELLPHFIADPMAGGPPKVTSNVPGDLRILGGHQDDVLPYTTVLLVDSDHFKPDAALPFVMFEYQRHWGVVWQTPNRP